MRMDDSLKAKITRELYESLFRYVDWGEGGRRAHFGRFGEGVFGCGEGRVGGG